MTNQTETAQDANFPILDRMTFLNHAGVGPLSGPAAAALRAYADHAAAAAYVDGGWYKRVGDIRAQAAKLIGARSAKEIAFVQNTTAGLAQVANGLDWRAGDNIVITDVEYPANRYPWIDLQRKGVKIIEAQAQPDGRIDLEDVLDAITNDTKVVSISHVQYSSGFRTDLKTIADRVHEVRGYLCVDAIQSVGVMEVDVAGWGVDFLAADGHKWMLGPEGCGLFYCREQLIEDLRPTVAGWMCMVDAANYGDYRFEYLKDARRFEPGSWNIPGILAMGASIDLLLDVGPANIWQRIEKLTAHLCERLHEKGYRVFSPRSRESERSGIVVFDPPADRDVGGLKELVAALERQGIIIVVREGRLRASPHFYNTIEQMDQLVDALP